MAGLSLIAVCSQGFILPAYADTEPELKRFNPQFVTEPGCPVEVVGASSELELDPFGSPVAARHYIDYRNISNRPVAAVKFRIGYVGPDGKISQPYVNGDDAHTLQPGEQGSKRWRGDKVDPRTTAVKIRVLKVKFADGTLWESVKVNETNAQQQQGFAPLTIESPGNVAGDFVPGQPVPFKEYGQQKYRGYPEQTTTGPVPFQDSAGAGGYAPGASGAVPAAGYAPMAGTPVSPGASPAASAAPQAGAPSFEPSDGGFGASAPGDFAAVPGAAPPPSPEPVPGVRPAAAPVARAGGVPPTAPPMSNAATQMPQTAPPVARPGSVSAIPSLQAPADPMATLDQILGTGKSAPPKPVASPATAAPSAAPAATSGASAFPASATPAGQPAAGTALPLRPQLDPSHPDASSAASDTPPGEGDKPVNLR